MLAPRTTLTPLENEVLDLRDRVAELEEMLRQRDEAYAPPTAFPSEWGLTAAETAILAVLYATRAPYARRTGLIHLLGRGDPEYDPKAIDVFLWKLRAKLTPRQITILTVYGEGYALTREGRARVAQALGHAPPEEPAPAPAAQAPRGYGWTPAEDKVLRAACARGQANPAIVRELIALGFRRRSPNTIAARAEILGLVREVYARVWTPPEDAVLRDHYEAGHTARELRLDLAAAGSRRSLSAIKLRLDALGLSGGRVRFVTDPERAFILAGARRGRSYADIRADLATRGFDRSTATIAITVRRDLDRRKFEWTPATDAMLRAGYAARRPVRAIAAEIGVALSTATKRASALGLTRDRAWSDEQWDRFGAAVDRGECRVAIAWAFGIRPASMRTTILRLNKRRAARVAAE